MKITILKSFSALLLLMITLSTGCVDSQKKNGAKNETENKSEKVSKKSTLTRFPTPTVPSVISSQEDISKYITTHYWDKFDFSDTTLISRQDITEQGFADFIYILSSVDAELSNSAINTMLSKAEVADSAMFDYFLSLSDKYLYDPNSPSRDEDLYIVVVKYIIASPKIEEIEKLRPRHILEIMMKNRVGDIANDFKYMTKSGKVSSLFKLSSYYTIVFFNNPDCDDCARVKKYIESSQLLNSLNTNNVLKILSFYPDENLNAWNNEIYPNTWINGRDIDQNINDNNLYDLKAIPSLYLLDIDKRVILKDAQIEQIENWLKSAV